MVHVSSLNIINGLAIGIAAILGVLTRAYINSLFGPDLAEISSSEDVVFYDLAANVLGCFIMGCHLSVKEQFDLPGPLALAVSTGYAGSVTSKFH